MRPVRGYRRGVAAGVDSPARFRPTQACRGEYTMGAVRWYLPPPLPGGSLLANKGGGGWIRSRRSHGQNTRSRLRVRSCSSAPGVGRSCSFSASKKIGPRSHRDAFGCVCGKTITLADRVDGTAYAIKTLLKGSIKARPGAGRD